MISVSEEADLIHPKCRLAGNKSDLAGFKN
jgi:hypothetical protein